MRTIHEISSDIDDSLSDIEIALRVIYGSFSEPFLSDLEELAKYSSTVLYLEKYHHLVCLAADRVWEEKEKLSKLNRELFEDHR